MAEFKIPKYKHKGDPINLDECYRQLSDMEEKCPCQTDVQSCCACVSMHCDECHKPSRSKFIQGRFCSNCGRPLKAELTRLYVQKSEVDLYRKQVDELEDELASTYDKLETAKTEVVKKIFEEIDNAIYSKHFSIRYTELKKKYTEEKENDN